MVHAFEVLGDPVRRRIMELLLEGECSAGRVARAVTAEFGISQPAVSRHLRILREQGFVSTRRVGTRRLYAIETAPLEAMDRWLERARRFWAAPLDGLAVELAREHHRSRHTDGTSTTRKDRDMSEIAKQDDSLTQVERSMKDTEIAAGRARAAVLRRRYEAPIEDVWKALTTPERVDRFFLPLSGDLREGGDYAFEGQASGKILVCEAPSLLRLEWVPPDRTGSVDQVEIRLSPDRPDATWLELEHASVADVFRTDVDADKYSPAIGWEGPLHYLGEYLRGVLPDRPSMEWYEFDEAEERRLAVHRGRAWTEAEARYAADGRSA